MAEDPKLEGEEQLRLDPIAEYIFAYNGAKLLEAKRKKAKKKLEGAKERLLALMDEMGTETVKRKGITISATKRNWGKVANFTELVEWISKQDEPRSQYMEEVFIKGSVKDQRGIHMMLKDAQINSVELGLPLHECMPDGLQMSTTDVLTVRKSKAAVEKETPKNKKEQLQQELEDF